MSFLERFLEDETAAKRIERLEAELAAEKNKVRDLEDSIAAIRADFPQMPPRQFGTALGSA